MVNVDVMTIGAKGAEVRVDWMGDEIAARVWAAADEALFSGAERIAAGAASRSPQDRPWHRDQWKAVRVSKRGSNLAQTGTLRNPRSRVLGSPLTGLLEYGTNEMGAQPHFWPAFDAVRPEVLGALEGAV